MKRIYLNRAKSEKVKGEIYPGVIDGFDVASVHEWKEDHEGKAAEVQRKKSQSHIKEIVESLKTEKRHFSWTMTVSIKGDMKIHEEIFKDSCGNNHVMYYILWPETEEEMEEWAPCIEINDGQHRCAALSKKYGLQKIFGSYDVTMIVMDHPEAREVKEEFRALNGRGKSMSRELMFQMSAEIGDLPQNVAEARKLLVRSNEDPISPMYKTIKFGEGKGMSSYTIVNRFVNSSFDIIKEMRDAGLNSFEERYNFFKKMLMAIEDENKINDDRNLKFNKDEKLKTISPTKYGAIIAMLTPAALQLPEAEGKNRTIANIREVYRTLINDVLLVDNIRISGNEAICYHYENKNIKNRTVSNRWNGNQAVNAATVDTYEALIAARQHFLKAEFLKSEVVKA